MILAVTMDSWISIPIYPDVELRENENTLLYSTHISGSSADSVKVSFCQARGEFKFEGVFEFVYDLGLGEDQKKVYKGTVKLPPGSSSVSQIVPTYKNGRLSILASKVQQQ
nr:hypothetical protein CFP56_06475 [Quercus suber]